MAKSSGLCFAVVSVCGSHDHILSSVLTFREALRVELLFVYKFNIRIIQAESI
jgi:hypothetical protein